MRIPRDISADDLIKVLKKYGFEVTRQKGSHIRLSKITEEGSFSITIPNHSPIKIGTLNNILHQLSRILNIPKEELIEALI
ncbi:MAG: type II toxin-antitoxin system HicA family toxin [Bacteroidetes bacterium]|nr:type II toxin-antitoxin system HicA family toxin [Bacteroidota bacterium]